MTTFQYSNNTISGAKHVRILEAQDTVSKNKMLLSRTKSKAGAVGIK